VARIIDVPIYDAQNFVRGTAVRVELTDDQARRGGEIGRQFNVAGGVGQLLIYLFDRVAALEAKQEKTR
jgi:hypothetical protein